MNALADGYAVPMSDKAVLGAVAAAWKVSVDDLRGPSRYKIHTIPRQCAALLLRRCPRPDGTRRSWSAVGLLLNRCDHSDAIYGASVAAKKHMADPLLRRRIERIARGDTQFARPTRQRAEIARAAAAKAREPSVPVGGVYRLKMAEASRALAAAVLNLRESMAA